MKYPILLKQFRQMLWTAIILVSVASASSIATMIWAVGLPTEKHIEITNRWLNWPEKDCYSGTEIDMIIEGP